ncbi:hypothetical protein HDK90DRAFT_184558 [Phyllosticta capitalensis]|uniref:Regulator of G protein signaling superfamily n=1 Tax=Phyllosticta capitalensis TaxID=121624 RepID=A0ABR1YW83_9PEZI
MVYSLAYRRPASSKASTISVHSDGSGKKSYGAESTSGGSQMSHGIPDALSFERIISGGTCPPCTVREFLNYLKYIELAAENLQFYLWFRDYCKRFDALPDREKALAPAWTLEQAEAEAHAQARKSKPAPEAAVIFQGTDFDNNARRAPDGELTPFTGDATPNPQTPSVHSKFESVDNSSEATLSEWQRSTTTATTVDPARAAEAAFESAGEKVQPFAVQPYREEITRIIAIYIAEAGPRQLNLSSRESNILLRALAYTTHPSAFRDVIATIEWSLRRQAHPNFIRWTICNGNRPRVIFARGLGIFLIVAGIVIGILLDLSSVARGWRVFSALAFLIGISTMIAAYKGMCVVLHGMHHRHLRPWELFASDDEPQLQEIFKESPESLQGNSFEDEPWVAKYEKRNVVRKVFDREVWIEEPAMRQIQDTIFLQSLLGAFVITCLFEAVFLAVPKGKFF